MSASTLFTIGYEQVPATSVLDTLEGAGVTLLVDVRAVAASRRPGFAKSQLAAGVASRGIGYLHLRGLGTPAEGRLAARTGKFDELRRIYAEHLATPKAREEMDTLASLVTSSSSSATLCLLCYERHPEHCHRAIIADLICERVGVKVSHLAAPPL